MINIKAKKLLSLSIIIPVYNEQDYLRHCLLAIAEQTIKPDEVIVVDNNSTDKTLDIAKSFPFVRIMSAKEQGVVYARDKGFDASRSEIIARIDADTHLPPHWVKSVKRLFSDPTVAAVSGPVSYFDMPRPKTNYWIDHQVRIRLYQRSPYAPFLFGTNMAIRRTVWEEVRSKVCHRVDVHEDLDLAIHLMQNGHKILYSKSILAATSSRRWDDKPAEFHSYMKTYRNSYKVHDITSRAPRIATSIYLLGYWLIRSFRLGYDPITNTRSFRRFLTHRKHFARRHPM